MVFLPEISRGLGERFTGVRDRQRGVSRARGSNRKSCESECFFQSKFSFGS